MHLNDETLRALVDHELDPGRMAEAEAHLSECDSCGERLKEIRARSLRVASSLSLQEGPAKTSPEAAFERLRPRLVEASPKRTRSWWRRARLAWAPAALVIVLAALLSVPSVRVWAGEFLGLFRVRHVTVLPVDTTRLSALSEDQPLTAQLSQLLSSSVTMTREAGDPQEAADIAQANQMAGFDVRLPTDREDTPTLLVQPGEAFDIHVDRARAQSLIEAAGFAGLELPPSIDGATISVDIPTGVTAGYGDCPALKEALSEGPDTTGSPGRQNINCIMLAEMPSPTVSTPPDMDIEQLAEIGLQFTGMSAAQAHQYSQTVDWTSTLVIPIPRNGASYQQVAVDGVTGYLIERPTDDAPQYALVWVKDGIIYAIGGLGNHAQDALDMAEAMP
jgi:hypothetical protein